MTLAFAIKEAGWLQKLLSEMQMWKNQYHLFYDNTTTIG